MSDIIILESILPQEIFAKLKKEGEFYESRNFEISTSKYSLGLPNNKNDTATILPKTIIMEGSMLDILIEAKTPLRKLDKDTKIK